MPYSLLVSFGFNGVLALVTVVTVIFCLGDPEAVLSDPTQEPFLVLFENSTGSKAAAVILAVPIVSPRRRWQSSIYRG